MKKTQIAGITLSALLALTAFAGVADAMTTASGNSMMQTGTTMKSDSMMSSNMDLYFGSQGDAVVTLQTFLESHGFLTIPAGVAHGYFGSLTKMAVMKYQELVGIRSTGYYGPLTRAAMSQAMMMKGSDSMMNSSSTTMMDNTGSSSMMH